MVVLLAGFAFIGRPQPADSPPHAQLRTPEQLDLMAGPIALYPDPLLAEVLAAATFPAEIVLADRAVTSGQPPVDAGVENWDPSVLALEQFPALLKWLDDNLVWTTAIGQAFLAQPADVMDAVQRLRAKAQALGNLQNTPDEEIVTDDGDIDILPAQPDTVSLPLYDPAQVFYDAPPAGGSWTSFGTAWPVGLWLVFDIDWHGHQIIYWPRRHPRPRDWWLHPGGRRPKLQYVERGGVVWTRRSGRTRQGVLDDERRWTGIGIRPRTLGNPGPGMPVELESIPGGAAAAPRPSGPPPGVAVTGEAEHHGGFHPTAGHGQPLAPVQAAPTHPAGNAGNSSGGGRGENGGSAKPR